MDRANGEAGRHTGIDLKALNNAIDLLDFYPTFLRDNSALASDRSLSISIN